MGGLEILAIAVVVVLGVAIGAIGLVIYAAGVRRGLW